MQVTPPRSFIELLPTLLALAVCFFAGCSKNPDRLYQDALAAEKDAREAYAQNDAKKARRAADRADSAASQLKKLIEADTQSTEEARRKLLEVQAAERAAREHAEKAEEEHQRRKMLGSLKVKAYQKGRAALLGGLLPQMAAAAEAAGRRGTNELSAVERPLAEGAWKLADLLGVANPLPDGAPDWAGAAAQLRDWSTNQTIEFRAFLALTFTCLGRTDFALAEFEPLDPAALKGTNALAIYHGGRTLLYTMEGWNHLASQEAERFSEVFATSEGPVEGRMLVAVLHAFMAYEAGSTRQFIKMDAEIAQSIRAWPENPMLVFLTGEKLASNGEWEKAAESLEASAAGTKDEWVAKRLAERARELRDGRGSTKAFALDARFLIPFAAQCLATRAKDSTAGRKLIEAVEEAKSFGNNLRQRLPLLGENDAGQSTQTNQPLEKPDKP